MADGPFIVADVKLHRTGHLTDAVAFQLGKIDRRISPTSTSIIVTDAQHEICGVFSFVFDIRKKVMHEEELNLMAS